MSFCVIFPLSFNTPFPPPYPLHDCKIYLSLIPMPLHGVEVTLSPQNLCWQSTSSGKCYWAGKASGSVQEMDYISVIQGSAQLSLEMPITMLAAGWWIFQPQWLSKTVHLPSCQGFMRYIGGGGGVPIPKGEKSLKNCELQYLEIILFFFFVVPWRKF